MLSELADFYTTGGPWMHPIAVCAVFMVAVAIDRFYALVFKFNVNAASFAAQIQKLVMANNIDRAIKLCNTVPKAALPRVLKAALTRANRGEKEISDAIEVATVESLRDINARTPMLPNIGNIATLLGLLGTVIGLIQAFATVATAPPDMRNTLLTQALAVALNTTALGLLIAIPGLALFMTLGNITQKITDDIDLYGLKLSQLLVARSKVDQAAGGGQGPQT